jgi:alpha-tubulin suppressor-like RCC1 family protein
MSKLTLLFFTFFAIFFLGCTEDTPSKGEVCEPSCQEWQECNSGVCELSIDRCETDNNCINNQDSKIICNTEKHICELGLVEECSINEDCKDASKPICKDNICIAQESNCIGMSFDTIEVRQYKNELIADSGDYQLTIGFYDADSPIGIYDLGAGNNLNYATCNQCTTISKITNETVDKTFFQESGTLEITKGDGRSGESVGEITNIKLIEVTISDDGFYTSTPVENGECIEIETGKTWSWNIQCTEGNKRCNSNDNTIEVCQPDHTWTLETACLETETCSIDVDNGIYCKAPYCVLDEKRCNDNGNVEVCKSDNSGNFWDISENCTNGAICEDVSFTCVEPPCNEGEKKCNTDNTGIKTCESGVWVESLCAVDADEICMGSGENTTCGLVSVNSNWIKVSADSVQSCGIKEVDGANKLYCWGTGSSGRLGNGTLENKLLPTEVNIAENSGWTDISVGGFHACGIKTGKVYCWGKNDRGQIGDSTMEDKDVPTEISGINSDFVSVEVGGYHSCAIKNDGKMFCWGRGDYGELGNNANDNLSTPVEISGNWTSVSLGDRHTCGIKDDGKLYCWGYGLYGRLGVAINDTNDRNIPTEVGGSNSDWVSVYSGYDHNCAIKTTGKMYCWGHGNDYKLGTETEDNKEIPTEIAGDNWVSASIGYYHSCGVKTVNEVNKAFCWGRGASGRLGINSEDNQTSPTEVSGSGWEYIQSGLSHNCGLQLINTKNVLSCWGSGSNGRLGTGNEDDKWIPTLIE